MGWESDSDGGMYYVEETPAPAEPQGTVTVSGAPDQGGGGGGGAVDQGTLNQLYEQYLGRGVDPSGAASWAGQSYEDVVRGITGSQEYAARSGDFGGGGGGLEQPYSGGPAGTVSPAGNLPGQDFNAPPTSDTEFVNKLYHDVFGRAPDEGAANWINALQSGQMTPQDIANSFVSSPEAQQNKTPQTTEQAIADAIAQGYTSGGLGVEAPKVNGAAEVANIYQNVLGRAPDPGAQVWIDQLNSGRLTVADVANEIASSREAQQRANASLPGDLAKNDPNNFSQNLYQLYSSALGRAPTASELAANVNAMNANPDSFAWIAQQVTGSKEAQDRGAKYGYDPEAVYQQIAGSYGHFTPTPEPGGLAGFANKIGPYAPFLMAAAALAAPALAGTAAAEGAAAAGGAAAGGAGTAGGLTSNATLNAILASAGKGALTGAAMGGISSGIQGGDVLQGVLRGGLTGAVGGGIGGGLGGTPLANIIGGAGAGAAGSALSGGNIGRGALIGGAGGALNYGVGQIPGLQSTPGQFGLGDIARGAITGGALSSAMGGTFGKGALGGIGGAYLSNQISPYINSAYNNYFGGPTANYGIGPTGINGTGVGFTSGAVDQALQQGLTATPTTLSQYPSPADMQAALAVTPTMTNASTWEDLKFDDTGAPKISAGAVANEDGSITVPVYGANFEGGVIPQVTLNPDGSVTLKNSSGEIETIPAGDRATATFLAAQENNKQVQQISDEEMAAKSQRAVDTEAAKTDSVVDARNLYGGEIGPPGMATTQMPFGPGYFAGSLENMPERGVRGAQSGYSMQDVAARTPTKTIDGIDYETGGFSDTKMWDPVTQTFVPIQAQTGEGGLSTTPFMQQGLEVTGTEKGSDVTGEVDNKPVKAPNPDAPVLKDVDKESLLQDAKAGELPTKEKVDAALAAGKISKEDADTYKEVIKEVEKATGGTGKEGVGPGAGLVGAGPGRGTEEGPEGAMGTQGLEGDIAARAAVAGAEPGPGENGTGEGEGGGGDGAGGGGGGGGGAGTGAGKGTGTGKIGTGGIPIPKLPTTTAARNVTINLPGMPNLTPGLVKGKSDYQLAGQFHFASGGGVSTPTTTGIGGTSMGQSPLDKYIATLTPGLVHGSTEDYHLPGYAEGGDVEEHNPEFFSEGGLGSLNNRYVKGKGDGTSDSIPAMLANGEFVIPADVVSSLGNGSNDSGAVLLDEFLRTIRKHKRAADAKHLPPDSKGPLGYLLEAKQKVKK